MVNEERNQYKVYKNGSKLLIVAPSCRADSSVMCHGALPACLQWAACSAQYKRRNRRALAILDGVRHTAPDTTQSLWASLERFGLHPNMANSWGIFTLHVIIIALNTACKFGFFIHWYDYSWHCPFRFYLTHFSIVTPYGDIELGQHWFI